MGVLRREGRGRCGIAPRRPYWCLHIPRVVDGAQVGWEVVDDTY
jgi:Fe-S-cluster containining protein